MSVSQYLKLFIGVLKDFRVIVTLIFVILVIEFTKFITTYRKKPGKVREKKAKIQASEENTQQEGGAEEPVPDMSEADTE